MYSETVRRLVSELPNRGRLETPTHAAETENPVCGDWLCLQLDVNGERIQEAGFQARGCPAALAGAAGLTQLIAGRSVAEASRLEVDDLLRHLDGLPTHKLHGAEMAIEALRRALDG